MTLFIVTVFLLVYLGMLLGGLPAPSPTPSARGTGDRGRPGGVCKHPAGACLMASPNDLLAALKGALATLPGIATLKIGIEEGLTADDYPLIRLVPTLLRQEPSIRGEVLEVIIY